MQSNQYREEAIPLVTFNSEKGKFEINEECRDFLRTLEGPIGVISVAGMYRTGKSYLLNRMLLNRSRGFDVGPTINACTKGVWIWGTPIDGMTPEGEPIKVLVLDTEGLGALDEDSNHDVRIFSLAILLSSFFIYNSSGSIDENSLSQLSLVINLTKHIQIKSGASSQETDPEEYAQYFPSFMWVVRDFALQLVDADHEPISSKEYLEQGLRAQKGFSESVEQKNRIRRLLTSFFKERDCVTMIRPLTKEDQLQNLADMKLEDLRPEFVQQIQVLRKKVVNRIKAKTINGKRLNGEMLFNLASSYAEAINNGAVPSIESSWSYICKNECQKALQDAYEVFEREFYEAYQNEVPMEEEQLKEMYKSAKTKGMKLFEKTAVGDVKEEFVAQLKEKMSSKFSHYENENKKSSEQQCEMFLQQNYELIEQKIRSQQYQRLDELSFDIREFQSYFMNEGPRGPMREVICQEFCYKAISEGADYFLKTLDNEVMLQQQLAEQSNKKLKSEIVELKDEKRKDMENIETKLRAAEMAKAELSAREQSIKENIAQLRNEKERIEVDAEERLKEAKKEAQRSLTQLNERMQISEDSQKDAQRQLMATESEFDKQNALMKQQIEFTQAKADKLETREKELLNELKNQKKENVASSGNVKEKFEKQLIDLTKKYDDAKEQQYDWESKHSDLEQEFQQFKQKMEDQETYMKKELAKFKDNVANLVKENDELKARYDRDITAFKHSNQQESMEQGERISELEEINKEIQEDNDNLKNQQTKYEAVHQQKMEFLEVSLSQERKQREEQKKNYDRMIATIQNTTRESVIGKAEVNQQMEKQKVEFQAQMGQLQDEYEKQLKTKNGEISQLTKAGQEIELKLQLAENDFKNQIDNLNETLFTVEKERNDLTELKKHLEDQKGRFLDEVTEKHNEEVQDLMRQLEEKERDSQERIEEINTSSEDQLNQLKQFFDSEKKRLEQRLLDEKSRAAKHNAQALEESDNKLRELQDKYEEDIDMLQQEMTAEQEDKKSILVQWDSEMGLARQQIDNQESIIHQQKEQLSQIQQSHQQQMDITHEKINSERRELVEKVERLNNDITKKERACTTLENQKEALVSQLEQKEKLLQGQKEETAVEKAELVEKFNQVKTKFEDKEDELTQKKIEFERERALKDQQIVFTEQKATDLQTQLERTVQRYEDRIKIDREEMQREIKEKQQRIQTEKEHADSKYEAKRKACKELENRLAKELANHEREQQILMIKYQNLETQQDSLIKNQEIELQRANEQIKQLQDALEGDKVNVSAELDRQRRELQEMERQYQDAVNNYDKDKALWEGKFNFLEQQRDQAKQELEEASVKFTKTIEQLQKNQHDNKNKSESSHSMMMHALENKFQSKIKEEKDAAKQLVFELEQRNKVLEREKHTLTERLELSNNSQMSDKGNLEKKLDKQVELNERLQDEMNQIKSERDRKLQDYQTKLERERETFNSRKREIESRASRAEGKQTELLLQQEREKAKWDQQMTDLMHAREDYKSEADRLKMKVDSQVKEIERLKNDNNMMRRQSVRQGGLSNQIGQGLAAKLNLGAGGTRASAYVPGMYNRSTLANPPTSGSQLDASEGAGTDRSYKSKLGSMRGDREVSASMDIGNKFLSQSLAGGLQSRLGAVGENSIGELRGSDNLLSTPQSKKSQDPDLINTQSPERK